MLSRDLVTQIITIASIFITVNGLPQRHPSSDNSIDVPNSSQRNQVLIRRIIETLSDQISKKLQSQSEEFELKNEIMVDQFKDLHQRPKHRIKRFTCWHSCLGPWVMKNPRLREMRHRISNIKPDSSTSFSDAEISGTSPGKDVVTTTEPINLEVSTSESETTETSVDEEAATETEVEATEATETKEEATEAPETEAETTEAPVEEPPAPENEEDGQQEKKEDKRQIGSKEAFEDDVYEDSAEEALEENAVDEDLPDDYVDKAATS